MRVGSLVSSAMLTESSNPTIAKKASVVAAITGQKKLVPATVEKSKARETSPFPAPIASIPTGPGITASRDANPPKGNLSEP